MFKTQTVNLAVWGWQTKFIVNNSLAEAINLCFDTRKFIENSACLRCAVWRLLRSLSFKYEYGTFGLDRWSFKEGRETS